jgi:hypothetical protein
MLGTSQIIQKVLQSEEWMRMMIIIIKNCIRIYVAIPAETNSVEKKQRRETTRVYVYICNKSGI